MSISEQDLARLAELYDLTKSQPTEQMTWLNSPTTRIETTNNSSGQIITVDSKISNTDLKAIMLFDPYVRFDPPESREPGSEVRPRLVTMTDMYTNVATFDGEGNGAFYNGITGDIDENDFDIE